MDLNLSEFRLETCGLGLDDFKISGLGLGESPWRFGLATIGLDYMSARGQGHHFLSRIFEFKACTKGLHHCLINTNCGLSHELEVSINVIVIDLF